MLDRPVFIACVALAVILPLGWLVYQKRKTEYTWPQFVMWVLAGCLTRFLWRATYENSMPGEVNSGAVIVSNHHSGVDPFFLQVCCKRPIRWMVAKEYCEHRVFGWMLRLCEVISVNRGESIPQPPRRRSVTLSKVDCLACSPRGAST